MLAFHSHLTSKPTHIKGLGALLHHVAHNLYEIIQSRENIVHLKTEQFKHRLIELLNIPGVSQHEQQVRGFLRRRLRKITDYAIRDYKGYILVAKFCGTGYGPTILLSGHMDTVEEIISTREIIEDGTILTSSEGILGADDRAGIAVILEVLSNINQTNFNGTLKIAFTVEEEIGCLGSKNMDKDFLKDVDGAIIIYRRDNRDIVTSQGGYYPFCSDRSGSWFEEAGKSAGMNDWRMTPGELSDAKVFADDGFFHHLPN